MPAAGSAEGALDLAREEPEGAGGLEPDGGRAGAIPARGSLPPERLSGSVGRAECKGMATLKWQWLTVRQPRGPPHAGTKAYD